MKNLFFVSVAFCIFSGTSFSATAQKGPKFIDGIEIKADNASNTQPSTSEAVGKKAVIIARQASSAGSLDIEKTSSIQFKYAQLLNRNVEDITNTSLYNFIEDWLETSYRYGGTTKTGIDCSAFTGLLEGTVYSVKIPRTAHDQYNECEKINKEDMLEGDLVFFNTRGGVSHVGVYLGDGYFVHASTNSGVTVSRLDDPYYERRFISGGRVSQQNNEVAGNR